MTFPAAPNRRQLLLAIVALAPTASWMACGAGRLVRHAADKHHPFTPQFFNAREWTFLAAACGRLIPEDEHGAGAVALGVPEFIDREMNGDFGHARRWYMEGPFESGAPELGHQSPLTPRDIYRLGLAQTDDWCIRAYEGRAFADLGDVNQDAVLRQMEAGTMRLAGTSSAELFELLLQNTKEGYLADPSHGGNRNMGSWKMIGFTGARADFMDWVDRPGEIYPHGPVALSGSRG
jgi:gluconate 2-dehydrogenase gamma chain